MTGKAFFADTNKNGRRDAGDTVSFRYTVTNAGPGKATGLAVKSSLGAASCGRSAIPAKGTAACTVTHALTLGDMDRGRISDKATASATGEDKHAVSAGPVSVTVTLPAMARLTASQRVSQVSDVNRDGRLGIGDQLRYSVTVTNAGTVTVKSLRLIDAKMDRRHVAHRCPKPSLAPGQSVTCTFDLFTVTRYDAKNSPVVNSASVQGTTARGVAVSSNGTVTSRSAVLPPRKAKVNKPATWHRPALRQHQRYVKAVKPHKVRIIAKLQAAQWVSSVKDANHNGRLDAGDSLVYSFAVANRGNVTIRNVAITDRRVAKQGLKITCDTTTLSPGEKARCDAEPFVITKWQAKNGGAGKNYGYATGLSPAGATVRSNATVTDHGIKAKADPVPTLLAHTGTDTGALLLGATSLIGLGAFLRLGSRRRVSRV